MYVADNGGVGGAVPNVVKTVRHVCVCLAILCAIASPVARAQRATPGHTVPGTPGGCLAAGDQYRDSAYMALQGELNARGDSAHPKPAFDAAAWKRAHMAVQRAAVTRDQQCAAAYDLATAPLSSLPDLGVLYFRSGRRELANRTFARAFGPQGLRDTARANAMLIAMRAYGWGQGYDDPRNRALSMALLPHIDSIPGALEQRVRARTMLPGAPSDSGADAPANRTANEIFALARQMSPAQIRRTASEIAGVYTGLATGYGDRRQADSALALLRTAPAELQGALASTIGRYEMIGRPAPAIHADMWVNGPGSERSRGATATLVVFTAVWCHPCQDSYPYIRALEREFGPRGLHVVFAVALEGQFHGVDMPPAQEVKADSGYYQEHGFTCPIAIYRREVLDTLGNVVSGDTSIATRYQMIALPEFYIIDRAGILRAEIEGWAAGHRRDHELHTEIERLLSGTGTG